MRSYRKRVLIAILAALAALLIFTLVPGCRKAQKKPESRKPNLPDDAPEWMRRYFDKEPDVDDLPF